MDRGKELKREALLHHQLDQSNKVCRVNRIQSALWDDATICLSKGKAGGFKHVYMFKILTLPCVMDIYAYEINNAQSYVF